MKTDKELLQLAAKAVGYETKEDKHSGEVRVKIKNLWPLFNPLTDDAQAFRLAVDLGVKIEQIKSSVSVYHPDAGLSFVSHGNDKHAATRRAIVRAAAAIGEAM